MNTLSFASAYRTAAILAAFSRASDAGDDLLRDPSRHHLGRELPEDAGWRSLLRRALAYADRCFPPIWMPVVFQGPQFGRDCSQPWSSRHQDFNFEPVEPLRGRALVSHFAFCDESAGADGRS